MPTGITCDVAVAGDWTSLGICAVMLIAVVFCWLYVVLVG